MLLHTVNASVEFLSPYTPWSNSPIGAQKGGETQQQDHCVQTTPQFINI